MEKERLDVLLVNRGMVESREKAKAIIMTGNVFVNEQREDKAGQKFPVDVYIEIRGKKLKFVSRGGYKLEKALQVFPIDLTDLTCMDVGASTGGLYAAKRSKICLFDRCRYESACLETAAG